MFKLRQPIQYALDRVIYGSIIASVLTLSWYGFPLVFAIMRMGSNLCGDLWSLVAQYIFTLRCVNNLHDRPFYTAWEHCSQLRQSFSMDFVNQCFSSGIDYQACVNIAQKTPFKFIEYFTTHDLDFDPFAILRLFPF